MSKPVKKKRVFLRFSILEVRSWTRFLHSFKIKKVTPRGQATDGHSDLYLKTELAWRLIQWKISLPWKLWNSYFSTLIFVVLTLATLQNIIICTISCDLTTGTAAVHIADRQILNLINTLYLKPHSVGVKSNFTELQLSRTEPRR